MNAYAIMYLNEHVDGLVADAARQRMYTKPGPSLSARVASIVAALRRAVPPIAEPDPFVPKLDGYPYRG